jgi:hypothetical protein
MRAGRTALLLTLGLAACVSKAPSANPPGATASPAANPTIGPSVKAPVTPSTGAGATSSAELLAGTATHEGVRVTLTLEGEPRTAAPTWARILIENLGARGVRWAGGGCGDPGEIAIDFRPAFAAGRAWPGLLGRFKALALGGGRFENPAAGRYVGEALFGRSDVACPDDLRVETLRAGGSLSMRAGWTGLFGNPGVPVPTGPAVVTGSFPFIGIDGAVGREVTDIRPIEVHIPTTIVGAADRPAPLSPALAVDAALGDPQFGAWVQAVPEASWINPSVDLTDGAWTIGLFRYGKNGELDLFGEVTIDPTGAITHRRFDPEGN